MTFAHLEAFLADSIRVVCVIRPEVLKSNRKITWKTIIDLGSQSDIIDHLIDQYVFNCTWGPITDTVKLANEKLGLHITSSDDAIERIASSQLLRNVIVHNGGRVSEEYLKRSNRSDVRLGEKLAIDKDVNNKTASAALELASRFFIEIGKTHFNKPQNSFSGVWKVSDHKT